MDIAKYMVTAILLTSVFSDFDKSWVLVLIIAAVAITLLVGLWLVKSNNKSIKIE